MQFNTINEYKRFKLSYSNGECQSTPHLSYIENALVIQPVECMVHHGIHITQMYQVKDVGAFTKQFHKGIR